MAVAQTEIQKQESSLKDEEGKVLINKKFEFERKKQALLKEAENTGR